MEKIILQIYVPYANKWFDVEVSKHATLFESKELINQALRDLLQGTYIPSGNETLCNFETGAIYNHNLRVDDVSLMNGDKVLLI